MLVELFATEDEVREAEARLRAAFPGQLRAEALAALAWALRERTPKRALDLVAEARRLSPPPPVLARLLLAEAHACVILVDDAADTALRTAEGLLTAVADSDPTLASDIALTRALRHFVAGNRQDSAAIFAEAADLCQAAGDRGRAAFAEAYQTIVHAYQGQVPPPVADPGDSPALSAALRACHDFAVAMSTTVAGDLANSARHFLAAAQAATGVGLAWLAGIALMNAADQLKDLQDIPGALELASQALDHALRMGSEGLARTIENNMAEIHLRAGRLDKAEALLAETRAYWARRPDTRVYSVCLYYLGELHIAKGEPARALRYMEEHYLTTVRQNAPELMMAALADMGRCLAVLGEGGAALARAEESLAKARERSNPFRAAQALHLIADLHRRFDLPRLPGEGRSDAESRLLREALDTWAQVEDGIPDPDILLRLAEISLEAGDLRRAFDYQSRHIAAKDRLHRKLDADRHMALQVREEARRAQAETERHRAMAEVLNRLVAIGREITAQLEPEAVIASLITHARALLPLDALALYRLDEAGRCLVMLAGLEGGQPLPPHAIALDDPERDAARSAREGRELVVDLKGTRPVEGTTAMWSGLFAPLLVNDAVIGVLTLQSVRAGAYGEREQLIFRSLCGYGAVALANADAYRQVDRARQRAEVAEAAAGKALADLRAAQAQLVQQEKLASLGQLVAGVAHEVNTPLGIALTTGSQVRTEVEDLQRAYGAGKLTRSLLEAGLDMLDQLSRLMLSNIDRAAELVQSFKSVAADRASDRRRRFDLAGYLAEILTSLRPMLDRDHVEVVLDVPKGLEMDGLPGLLSQVVINLVENALKHAFDRKDAGRQVTIQATPTSPGWVELRVADNGCGVPEASRARVFDPFYTTKRGAGGTGLGLHIVHNLVVGPLGGSIELLPDTGAGAAFRLRLPMVAPGTAGPDAAAA